MTSASANSTIAGRPWATSEQAGYQASAAGRELSRHLGDTLVAQTRRGQALLLRSFIQPKALTGLHAAEDCAWHASPPFVPGRFNHWWLPGSDNERSPQYPGWGLKQRFPRAYSHNASMPADGSFWAMEPRRPPGIAGRIAAQRPHKVFPAPVMEKRLAQVESLPRTGQRAAGPSA